MEATWSALDLKTPPFYHCVSRDVYRSFSGEEEYRLRCVWIEQQLNHLSSIFAVDIGSYTILANNYHIIVHVNEDKADAMTMTEVVKHWHQIAEGTALSRAYELGHALKIAELEALQASVEIWRKRLRDVSWFMRTLNDAIKSQMQDFVVGDFYHAPVAVYPH